MKRTYRTVCRLRNRFNKRLCEVEALRAMSNSALRSVGEKREVIERYREAFDLAQTNIDSLRSGQDVNRGVIYDLQAKLNRIPRWLRRLFGAA